MPFQLTAQVLPLRERAELPLWRNGRRDRLKICCSQGRGGSSPSRGTKSIDLSRVWRHTAAIRLLFVRLELSVLLARVFAALVTLFVLNSLAAAQTTVGGPTLLFDAQTGEVLSQERAGEPWYPASLTKLMTAYVVFQKLRNGSLRLDQQIPVSEVAASQEPSKIGIPAGKTVTVDFALQALLVYSANDMAYVLAEASSGSYQRFADEMNAVSKALGLSATHFINPNGLFDPRHVTSARDIGVLAAVIVNEFPQYSSYFEQEYLAVGKRRLPNRNSLIRIMPDADGMKTGFVCNSGYNLVASATRNGRKLIAVILGAKSGGARAIKAKDLLEQGFASLPQPGRHKVAEVVNLPQGAIVPADMTTTVCRRKSPVQLSTGEGLQGWAVSFGTYDNMMKADMALRGRMLSPIGINTKTSVGVVRLPDKAGFAALAWDIPQDESLSLCTAYRAEGAHCDVMPPALVDTLAQYLKSLQPAEKPVSQGAESDSDDEPAPVVATPKKKRVKQSFPIKKKNKR
jgi:D-alanyl-D-alanine carboxypeptidase